MKQYLPIMTIFTIALIIIPLFSVIRNKEERPSETAVSIVEPKITQKINAVKTTVTETSEKETEEDSG